MKILIVRTYPDKLNIDSYNVQEIGLAKALVLKGYECDIVLFNGNQKTKCVEYPFYVGGKEYTYRIFWCRGINLLKMGIMPNVVKLINDYDVVQVHEYEQLLSWHLYRRQIRPTIIYHGLYASEYTKGYNLKCKVFEKIFFRWFRYPYVVCATKSKLATDFMKSKGFERIYSLGVGLDVSRFQSISREHKDFVTEYSLLYVGKIEDRRNSLFLIDIVDELLARGINVKLKVIGKGDKVYLERFLQKADKLISAGKMTYIPQETQEQLAKEYCSADAFVFPSKYEIFGMVLLETMYFGCPVISSYNGGASMLIDNDETGLIVNTFNVEEWADSIEQLLLDSNRRKIISNNATKLIKEKYLWDSIADKFIELYKEAIHISKK